MVGHELGYERLPMNTNKLESDVKRDIVNVIRFEGGYARRIEDKFSVGMPDLVLIPMRCPVTWAEVKIIRSTTFGPSPRQLVELQKLHKPPYSFPIVIGYKDGTHYISGPQLEINIHECVTQELGETIGHLIRRFYGD